MKSAHVFFLSASVLFLLLISADKLSAQSDAGNYLKISYLQVEKGDLDEFTQSLDGWRELHSEKIARTERVSWRLYHVPFSSNTASWYNFVVIETALNLNALQRSGPLQAEALATDRDRKTKLAYAFHSEIWKTEAGVYGDRTPPSRYMNANFMYAQPFSLDEYLELETDIAKPLHQNQVDNNRMDGWNFHRLAFPTGSSVAYNFLTADYYSSLEQIEMGISRQIIEHVHPDMDVDEFEDFADSIRERVWSDLWELVSYVN